MCRQYSVEAFRGPDENAFRLSPPEDRNRVSQFETDWVIECDTAGVSER